MNHAELAKWAEVGMNHAADSQDWKRTDWWPAIGLAGQGIATTFSWALVMHAADLRFGSEYLALHAPWHGEKHKEARKALVKKHWKPKGRKHWKYELLVDFAVVAYKDESSGQQVRLIAESEMYAGQDVSDTLYRNYAWDFVKLMLMQAPLRLFTCRVGTVGETSGFSRRDELERSLALTVKRHRAGLRAGDDLGVVILPEDWKDGEWRDLRVGVLVDGELVFDRPWAG